MARDNNSNVHISSIFNSLVPAIQSVLIHFNTIKIRGMKMAHIHEALSSLKNNIALEFLGCLLCGINVTFLDKTSTLNYVSYRHSRSNFFNILTPLFTEQGDFRRNSTFYSATHRPWENPSKYVNDLFATLWRCINYEKKLKKKVLGKSKRITINNI